MGKYKVDNSDRQSNLLSVLSWEAIKITTRLISSPQLWTEGEIQLEFEQVFS